MAVDPDEPGGDQPYTPTVPQNDILSPPLRQLRAQATPNDDGSTWADGPLADIQQHANQNLLVDANQAAGDRWVQQLGEIKDNLTGMVHADPSSVDLALKLAPQLVAPMVHAAGMPDDQAEDTHGQLSGHIQTEIARAAITRMADLHADNARGMLDRLGDHLADGDAPVLGSYIDTMQAARTADNAAANGQSVLNQQRGSAIAAYHFGSSLLDPRTESTQFPPDYLQSLVRNRDIQPDDKQALFGAYSRLMSPGDVTASDPYTVRQMLSAIGNPNVAVGHGDIMAHVGQDMRYVDAVMLHGLSLQRTPDGIGAAKQLGGLLDQAQRVLAPGTDRAGNVAYSRFVNWLLPSYRRTGVAGLNPGSYNYLFNNVAIDNFRPQHADAVEPIAPVNRKTLNQIFAGDVVPLNPAGQTGFSHPPGVTGDLLDRMRELGITGYSHPSMPVQFPVGPAPVPANG